MFSYLKTQLWIFIKLKFQFFNWIFTSLSQVLGMNANMYQTTCNTPHI